MYVISPAWKNRNKRPNVGGVSIIRRRNGDPSRTGFVVQ